MDCFRLLWLWNTVNILVTFICNNVTFVPMDFSHIQKSSFNLLVLFHLIRNSCALSMFTALWEGGT